ncbi:MAG TPA: ATP synthase F1 subunit gamma [Patescibacteria group bacterium]|nr:ATP synthase F1 subunit gamma [Patescibacteria group bacterium]
MNLRQARKKIKTIGNVSKITKAMQMVSAVKMKRAQKDAFEGREYRTVLDMIAQKVMSIDDCHTILQSQTKKNTVKKDKNLFVLITSNKGLCGSFNVNLFRFLSHHTRFEKDDFIVVGKKGAEFLAHIGASIKANFSDQKPLISAVSPLFSLIYDHFVNQTYATIFIVYNKCISTFKNEPVMVQLFPIKNRDIVLEVSSTDAIGTQQYMIEPSLHMMITALLKDMLQEKIKTAFLDSMAGEHASRMIAMKNATDSAEDIMYNLTRLRNKLRQQNITYELLDMIAASSSSSNN